MDAVTPRLCPVPLDPALVAAAIAVDNAVSTAAVVAAAASAVDVVVVVSGVVIAMASVVLTAHHLDLAVTTGATETVASRAVGTIRAAAADAHTTTDLAATETVVVLAETVMVADAPAATWSPSADAMVVVAVAVVVVAIATATGITIDLGMMTAASVATTAATMILASSVDTKSLLSGHPVGRRFHCNPYSICPFLGPGSVNWPMASPMTKTG